MSDTDLAELILKGNTELKDILDDYAEKGYYALTFKLVGRIYVSYR